jgi:hypothetical protein
MEKKKIHKKKRAEQIMKNEFMVGTKSKNLFGLLILEKSFQRLKSKNNWKIFAKQSLKPNQNMDYEHLYPHQKILVNESHFFILTI